MRHAAGAAVLEQRERERRIRDRARASATAPARTLTDHHVARLLVDVHVGRIRGKEPLILEAAEVREVTRSGISLTFSVILILQIC